MAREEYLLDAMGKDLVRILPGSWRNFKGVGSQYNPAGRIFFNVAINDESLVETLKKRGFNVKDHLNKNDPDEAPTHILKISVRFNDYGPKVTQYVEGNNHGTKLDEDTIGILDDMDITDCIIKIRPYDWTSPNGKGTAAYLSDLSVQTPANRFDERFRGNDVEDINSDNMPF